MESGEQTMKTFARTVSLFLCLMMLFSLSVTAFATDVAAPAADTADKASTDTGIIDAAEMQKMLDDYVAQYSLNTKGRAFCVGFCYLKTGDMWFYNEDKWCYSASLYKVPVSMLCAQKEMAGEITADTRYENQYNTGTLDQLEMKALVNSDNDAGHALVQWMGGTYAGKCADQIIQFTDLPESYFNQDFFSVSYYNVNFFTQVLRELYNNQQNYPRIINYMKQMKTGLGIPDLAANLGGTYEVAQKYGSFEETKTNPPKNNKHVGGIIYTPSPIAVTIMTVNIDNFPDRIGEVAKMLADYSLTLDSRYAAYQAEQARQAQEEAARAAQAEQERLAAEAAARQAQMAATSSNTPDPNVSIFVGNGSSGSSNTNSTSSSSGISASGLKALFDGMDSTQKIIILAGIAVFVVGILLLIVALIVRARRNRDDDYDEDYEDYDEYDDYDDRRSRKAAKTKAAKPEKVKETKADRGSGKKSRAKPAAPAETKRSSRKMSKREEEYYDDLPAQDVGDEEFYYDPEEFAQPEGDAYGYDDASAYDDGYAYDDSAYDEAAYDEGAYDDASFGEDFPDDALDGQDYLTDDSFLDDSDFDDFKDFDPGKYDL